MWDIKQTLRAYGYNMHVFWQLFADKNEKEELQKTGFSYLTEPKKQEYYTTDRPRGWCTDNMSDKLTRGVGGRDTDNMTSILPLHYWSSTVYSGDVVDSHGAPAAGQPSAEPSDGPPPLQSDQPASASTPPDGRAVIILIPVRLGGEKTNPEYFDFAKVRYTRGF